MDTTIFVEVKRRNPSTPHWDVKRRFSGNKKVALSFRGNTKGGRPRTVTTGRLQCGQESKRNPVPTNADSCLKETRNPCRTRTPVPGFPKPIMSRPHCKSGYNKPALKNWSTRCIKLRQKSFYSESSGHISAPDGLRGKSRDHLALIFEGPNQSVRRGKCRAVIIPMSKNPI